MLLHRVAAGAAGLGVDDACRATHLFSYWRLAKTGYRFPFLKVFLVVSTGLCSLVSWGFNTWGEAFFIMNLFHAVQYLALVWAMEHKQILTRLRLPHSPAGRRIGVATFLSLLLLYGFGVQMLDPGIEVLWAGTLVVSLMHFWYDGFIWSVRRKQV